MGTKVVVQGTLKPDGTLELDEKPNLPPGRVQVTVQPVAAGEAAEEFRERMKTLWANQRARGHVARTMEEVEAQRKALNDEMEQEIQEAMRLQQEARQARQQVRPAPETDK